MTTTDALALAASVVACLGAIVALVAAGVLVGQVRRLERGIDALRDDALAVLRDARTAAGQATAELGPGRRRPGDTESVTATVESAARLTERAFANPVVKVLAWRAGASGALRRLAQPSTSTSPELAAGRAGSVRRPDPPAADRRIGAGSAAEPVAADVRLERDRTGQRMIKRPFWLAVGRPWGSVARCGPSNGSAEKCAAPSTWSPRWARVPDGRRRRRRHRGGCRRPPARQPPPVDNKSRSSGIASTVVVVSGVGLARHDAPASSQRTGQPSSAGRKAPPGPR